ncbi:hypothetical protein NN561_019200 [Cricetulus griseus]
MKRAVSGQTRYLPDTLSILSISLHPQHIHHRPLVLHPLPHHAEPSRLHPHHAEPSRLHPHHAEPSRLHPQDAESSRLHPHHVEPSRLHPHHDEPTRLHPLPHQAESPFPLTSLHSSLTRVYSILLLWIFLSSILASSSSPLQRL